MAGGGGKQCACPLRPCAHPKPSGRGQAEERACVCANGGVQVGGVQMGEKHPGKNKGGGVAKMGGGPARLFSRGGGGWQVCNQGAQVCKAEEHLCP